MGNVYRFSTRDGVKYLTCNGEDISNNYIMGWGWYGKHTSWAAFLLLLKEYGFTTASRYFDRFAREYLANMTCDEFTWTSGVIACMIHEMEKT
jgi:hypothetical protein